jgi:hypothetical protein
VERPSHKELNTKLHAAMSAVQENRIILVEPRIIVAHAVELGYSIQHELQQVMLELLQHTGPEHYAGQRPPQKSYETRIHLLDLWAFSVTCPTFEPRVYYKFSLKNDYFYLVSLHVSTSAAD